MNYKEEEKIKQINFDSVWSSSMKKEHVEITAKAWILMDKKTSKYWRGNNTMQKLEIASLTKMYTLEACFLINQILNIYPSLTYIHVIPTTNIGTLANLEEKKYILLNDLFYGLMLPSGNDAALLLAYYYGYWLGKKERFAEYEWGSKNKKRIFSLQGKKKYSKIYLTRFIAFMNEDLLKKRLKHENTHFQNPHGLPDKLQRSTAWEVAHAAMQFLRRKDFATIVKAEKHAFRYLEIENKKEQASDEREWRNTNVLLEKGFIGIKTGHTISAGNCLCSRKITEIQKRTYDLIIVVLGCSQLQDRFTETVQILSDFVEYRKMTE